MIEPKVHLTIEISPEAELLKRVYLSGLKKKLLYRIFRAKYLTVQEKELCRDHWH